MNYPFPNKETLAERLGLTTGASLSSYYVFNGDGAELYSGPQVGLKAYLSGYAKGMADEQSRAQMKESLPKPKHYPIPGKPKEASPFKLINSAEGILIEAAFPLPTDDTPDSLNLLVVRIFMEAADSEAASVQLLGRSNIKDTIIVAGAARVESLAQMFYKFARIVMRPTVEFSA